MTISQIRDSRKNTRWIIFDQKLLDSSVKWPFKIVKRISNRIRSKMAKMVLIQLVQLVHFSAKTTFSPIVTLQTNTRHTNFGQKLLHNSACWPSKCIKSMLGPIGIKMTELASINPIQTSDFHTNWQFYKSVAPGKILDEVISIRNYFIQV